MKINHCKSTVLKRSGCNLLFINLFIVTLIISGCKFGNKSENTANPVPAIDNISLGTINDDMASESFTDQDNTQSIDSVLDLQKNSELNQKP
ncbi:MAG: hypothetical protein ABF461_05955 [Zymomonas mobilis subsp. pomaceae]|uniref:Lipoprotein n=2 Tax=Zymomonas mobilis TaxID=542 RepID=F8ERU3_ZYMMT|nr:hypothetical protein [Zymomonas mobilis]AEI38556.1 hypothetical protein Zymop_1668 [Zymomonas mobilis subsp. pomaceae ATCC 29192]MDX5948246.1 hypothetical protein [Zymomonas mobilis subsp. pomaceae]GEB89001.1 hypothetical protein ZMO02_06380 [Zymomonas mobilis subsp. pomaceae]